jgi:guanosine-3',5'-bis(diphosphate) 3'-pyrophosphohydrolase
MNLGNKELERRFEHAVRLLSRYMPDDPSRRKPIVMHALRVGMFLYEKDYSEHVVLAGFMHDIVEWTDCPPELVSKTFGQRVLDIVQANTKDRSIEDPVERRADYVKRCAELGEDALIVKAADALDSYRFYKSVGDVSESERSMSIAKLVLEIKTDEMKDPIFDELKTLK